MNKQITFIIAIFLLSSVSALSLTAGNSVTFDSGLDVPLVWDVIGNQSDLSGWTISQEGSMITIDTEYWITPENLTLIFFDNSTKETIETVTVYSRSSKIETIYEDKEVIEYVDRDVIKYINETTEPEIKELTKYVYKRKYVEYGIIVFISILIGGLLGYFIKKDPDK